MEKVSHRWHACLEYASLLLLPVSLLPSYHEVHLLSFTGFYILPSLCLCLAVDLSYFTICICHKTSSLFHLIVLVNIHYCRGIKTGASNTSHRVSKVKSREKYAYRVSWLLAFLHSVCFLPLIQFRSTFLGDGTSIVGWGFTHLLK